MWLKTGELENTVCSFVEFVLKPFRQQICHMLFLLQMLQFFLSILNIFAEIVLYGPILQS